MKKENKKVLTLKDTGEWIATIYSEGKVELAVNEDLVEVSQ